MKSIPYKVEDPSSMHVRKSSSSRKVANDAKQTQHAKPGLIPVIHPAETKVPYFIFADTLLKGII